MMDRATFKLYLIDPAVGDLEELPCWRGLGPQLSLPQMAVHCDITQSVTKGTKVLGMKAPFLGAFHSKYLQNGVVAYASGFSCKRLMYNSQNPPRRCMLMVYGGVARAPDYIP